MINFKLPPYEWQKSMEIVYENMNLEKIEIIDKNIDFNFTNSYNGDFAGILSCINAWKIQVESSEALEYPAFVCDIRLKKLKGEEIADAFKYMKFGFEIPKSTEYHLMCFDSGELSIALICEAVEVNNL